MKIDTGEFKELAQNLLNSIRGAQIAIKSDRVQFAQSLLYLCNAYDDQEKEIERLRNVLNHHGITNYSFNSSGAIGFGH